MSHINPRGYSLSGSLSQFKLNGASRLLLQHCRSARNSLSIGHIRNFQLNQITVPKFTVQSHVKQSQIADFSFPLKTDTNPPDIRDLKRPFLADNAAPVPGGMLSCSISIGLGDVIMSVPYERRADVE